MSRQEKSMWLRVAARVLNAEGKRMGHQLARGERGGGGNEGTPFCLLRSQHQCDSGSQ